jgi:hypothetical protein
MMKNVNRTIAGMIMRRYVGATGNNSFFTMMSGFRLAGAAVRWEGSAVAVMPAS